MAIINCVGIFCEDIREEITGTHTIVGVMPDTIAMAGGPPLQAGMSYMIPRLGIYIRIHFDPSMKPTAISSRVSIPGNPDFILGNMDVESVTNAIREATSRKFPIVGLIFKGTLSPLQISEFGVAKIIVTVDEEEIVCGIVNIQGSGT
jgi:hypothetical protein